jgi:hypothetical protein
MNTTRFARMLDRRGPALACWPAADRAAAKALLAVSAEARALLNAAATLDARLRRDLPGPDPEAVARLREGVARHIARSPLPAPPGWRRRLVARLRPAMPVGWGALAAMATCALWLSLSPPRGEAGRVLQEDPLSPLQTLPLAGDSF